MSCPGAGDGNISVNILDLSTNSALQGATFEWSITDPETGNSVDLNSNNNQEILTNIYGITGQGGQLKQFNWI